LRQMIPLLNSVGLVLIPVCIGTLWSHFWDGYGIVTAIYWSVTTVTTVGYGDVLVGPDPEKELVSRIFVIVFILISVPCFGFAFSKLNDTLMAMRAENVKHDLLSRTLSPQLLADFDVEGDGVDKTEFLCGMLLILDACKGDILVDILDKFESLDKDQSGILTAADLAALRPTRQQDSARHSGSKPAHLALEDQLDAVESSMPVARESAGKKRSSKGAGSNGNPEADKEFWEGLMLNYQHDQKEMANKLTEVDRQLTNSMEANLQLERSLRQENTKQQVLVHELRLLQYKFLQLQRQHEEEACRRKDAEARCEDVLKSSSFSAHACETISTRAGETVFSPVEDELASPMESVRLADSVFQATPQASSTLLADAVFQATPQASSTPHSTGTLRITPQASSTPHSAGTLRIPKEFKSQS